MDRASELVSVRPQVTVVVSEPRLRALAEAAIAREAARAAARGSQGSLGDDDVPARTPCFATAAMLSASGADLVPQYADGTPVPRPVLDTLTCTAPPVLCECHHIEHWARDHGSTSVDNGILLCVHHHEVVHNRNLEIHRAHGRFVFLDAHGMVIDPDHDLDVDVGEGQRA